MNNERIKRTEAFLKQKYDAAIFLNANPGAKVYRLEHSYRVANIGRQIARREGFDEIELVIGCLLHDVSYCEEFGENGWKEHGRRAAEISLPFLKELGLADDRIQDICYGIAIHVDDEADFAGERTPFALSIGDADNLDRMDAYRLHEHLCYEKFLEKSFDEKRSYVESTIARLRKNRELPMGTKTAEEIWQARVDFAISFHEKLALQLQNSDRILP